ncbi:MAG TPA: hypothetical protein VL970_14235 [Candidatus Acidoferrales bacterium]|nr:hypothetical protein [Candidatus Acidoferrales bacterium]
MTSSRKLRSGEAAPAFEKTPELSPFVHEFFMVQADEFRGMAYCDEDGKWRTAYKDEELSGDICFFE